MTEKEMIEKIETMKIQILTLGYISSQQSKFIELMSPEIMQVKPQKLRIKLMKLRADLAVNLKKLSDNSVQSGD